MRMARLSLRRKFLGTALPALLCALALSGRQEGEAPKKTAGPLAPPAAFSAEGWNQFQRVFGIVLRDYVDPKSPGEVLAGALVEGASLAGPESAYIPPDRVADYLSLSSAAPSLPLFITKGDDYARVLALLPGAEKSISPSDALRSVGGRSTYDLSYPECLLLLRGKAGETTSCGFLRREGWEAYTASLVRSEPPKARWVARASGGVLVVTSLQGELSPELLALAKTSKGAVLVDLRACAEGDAPAAIRLAGLLLGKRGGPVSRGQKGDRKHPVSGAGHLAGRKLRALVGGQTSRGGEVLASALHEAGALLAGEPTLGWAPLSEDFRLSNGGILRLNTGYFLAPDGIPLKDHPISPAVPVQGREGEGEDALYDRVFAAATAVSSTAARKAEDGRR